MSTACECLGLGLRGSQGTCSPVECNENYLNTGSCCLDQRWIIGLAAGGGGLVIVIFMSVMIWLARFRRKSRANMQATIEPDLDNSQPNPDARFANEAFSDEAVAGTTNLNNPDGASVIEMTNDVILDHKQPPWDLGVVPYKSGSIRNQHIPDVFRNANFRDSVPAMDGIYQYTTHISQPQVQISHPGTTSEQPQTKTIQPAAAPLANTTLSAPEDTPDGLKKRMLPETGAQSLQQENNTGDPWKYIYDDIAPPQQPLPAGGGPDPSDYHNLHLGMESFGRRHSHMIHPHDQTTMNPLFIDDDGEPQPDRASHDIVHKPDRTPKDSVPKWPEDVEDLRPRDATEETLNVKTSQLPLKNPQGIPNPLQTQAHMYKEPMGEDVFFQPRLEHIDINQKYAIRRPKLL